MVTRPESGISSRYFYEYVGKNSTKDYKKGQKIVDPETVKMIDHTIQMNMELLTVLLRCQ